MIIKLLPKCSILYSSSILYNAVCFLRFSSSSVLQRALYIAFWQVKHSLHPALYSFTLCEVPRVSSQWTLLVFFISQLKCHLYHILNSHMYLCLFLDSSFCTSHLSSHETRPDSVNQRHKCTHILHIDHSSLLLIIFLFN